MNPSRRKLLYRLGAAKQDSKPTVAPVVEEVKPVVVEAVEIPAVVVEQVTAEVEEAQEESVEVEESDAPAPRVMPSAKKNKR